MNRGAIKTMAALKKRDLSVNKGAALVGCDSGTFSKILREVDGRKPGRALAARIELKLGISAALWDQEVPDSQKPAKPAA